MDEKIRTEHAPAYAASRRAEAKPEASAWGYLDGITFTLFDRTVYCAALTLLKSTDEAEFLTTEIIPIIGLSDTPEHRAEVLESLRKIDAAGLLRVPEFHAEEDTEEADGTTWYGLDAKAMASVLDIVFDSDFLDNEEWNELFERHGSPYRVARPKGSVYDEARPIAAWSGVELDGEGDAPGNPLHWRVDSVVDGRPLTMAAFYTKGDAEDYAERLNAAAHPGKWHAEVVEISR